MSHQEAVAELRRCAGIQFDPQLVQKFIQINRNLTGRYRPGVMWQDLSVPGNRRFRGYLGINFSEQLPALRVAPRPGLEAAKAYGEMAERLCNCQENAVIWQEW
jgi:hypothetical protein